MSVIRPTFIETSGVSPNDFVAVSQVEPGCEFVTITIGERCDCHSDCLRAGNSAETLVHIDELRTIVAVLNERIETVDAEEAKA